MTAAVVSVLILGGVAATPAFAAEHGASKQHGTSKGQPAAHAKAKTSKAKTSKAKAGKKIADRKTVIYHGYELKVPASWPVYYLGRHPSTCVRYDRHAVYLGTPGLNMQCPAGLIGRTSTVSVIPSVTVAAGSGSEITYQKQQPDSTGNTPVRSLTAVHATLTRNTAARELRVALGAAALTATVVATYGKDPAVVERVLDSLRVAPSKAKKAWAKSSASAQRAAATAATAASEAATVPAKPSAKPNSKGWHGLPPGWPVHVVSPPRKPRKPTKPTKPVHPVNGIDACTAPSLAAMRAWSRDYRAIGFYIGGNNVGCAAGNASASWLKSIEKMGWGAMPIYVGPQAVCTTARGVWEISAHYAVAEGRLWGKDAVKDARKFGLGRGSPIFYDMEAYNSTTRNPGCRAAVLTFLSSWDRTVAAAGYETAVYSSAASGIRDMQHAAAAKRSRFTAPDAIWIAEWDADRTLTVTHPPLHLSWPLAYRAKQYRGEVWQAIGGYRLNVDVDYVGGPLAR